MSVLRAEPIRRESWVQPHRLTEAEMSKMQALFHSPAETYGLRPSHQRVGGTPLPGREELPRYWQSAQHPLLNIHYMSVINWVNAHERALPRVDERWQTKRPLIQ